MALCAITPWSAATSWMQSAHHGVRRLSTAGASPQQAAVHTGECCAAFIPIVETRGFTPRLVIADEDVLSISRRIMENNREAYEVLAK